MRALTLATALCLFSASHAWAETYRSPLVAPAPDARDDELLAACGRGEAGLHEVAARLVRGEITGASTDGLIFALRASGVPHLRPRAWTLQGTGLERTKAAERLHAWLSGFADEGQRRCGIASGRDEKGRDVFAAVVVFAQADLAPTPMKVRPGQWVTLDARLRVPAHGAKVVVLGPTGRPRSVPTSFSDNRVRARFRADREGLWLAQVLIDGDAGPRPVLETMIFADIPVAPPEAATPGEEASTEIEDPEDALTEMIARARRSERLPPLLRDASLDEVARAHAVRMRKARRVAHDVGDGPPHERLREADVFAAAIGENVAHAASVASAHRALWASPSHRGNLLDPRFERVGVAVIPDADGSVWVTQIFAGRFAEP